MEAKRKVEEDSSLPPPLKVQRTTDETSPNAAEEGDAVASGDVLQGGDTLHGGDGLPGGEQFQGTESFQSGEPFGAVLIKALAVEEGVDPNTFEDAAWNTLATAVEYRLRTLVEEAVKVARRCTCESPNVVLDAHSVRVASQLLEWTSVSKTMTTPKLQPGEVDFADILSEPSIVPLPAVPTINVRWTVLHGKAIPCPEPALATKTQLEYKPQWRFTSASEFHSSFLHRDFADVQSRKAFFMSVIFHQPADTQILAIPEPLNRILSDEQRVYIERVQAVITEAIAHTRNHTYTKAQRAHGKLALDRASQMVSNAVLRSLARGPTPPKVLPFILSMACKEVPASILQGPPQAALVPLSVLQAITQNERADFFPYLGQILHAVLLCLLTPLIGGSSAAAISDAMIVRRLASQTLARVVASSMKTKSTAAWTTSVEVLGTTLQQTHLPLTTLVGAVLGAQEMGQEVIDLVVKPVAPDLIVALKLCLTQPDHEDSSHLNADVSMDPSTQFQPGHFGPDQMGPSQLGRGQLEPDSVPTGGEAGQETNEHAGTGEATRLEALSAKEYVRNLLLDLLISLTKK